MNQIPTKTRQREALLVKRSELRQKLQNLGRMACAGVYADPGRAGKPRSGCEDVVATILCEMEKLEREQRQNDASINRLGGESSRERPFGLRRARK